MSDPDARTELARIARGVRQALGREDARGLAELLARDGARAPRVAADTVDLGDTTPAVARGASPVPAAATSTTPRRDMAPAAPPATSRPEAPTKPSVGTDLFGNPLPAAPPSALGVVAASAPSLSPVIEYNPRGRAEREAILASSLPLLEAAAAEIHDCRKCGLCETRTNTVPGVGSARSGIVFVGEAPGADEDAQGEPFVGRAGQLLTRIIQAMEDAKLVPGVTLTRDSVYICNVLKCRPPENRNPLPNEVEQCSPYLLRQLDALKPRVICCLGKFAAELLLGVKGTIASMRGRVYTFRGAKMIVTYHPAACLRNPGYKRPVWEDMQLLAREYLSD